MPKKGGYGKFKTYKRKLKSSFIISADFESILAPEGNRKQKPEESHTNKMLFTVLLITWSKKKYCGDIVKKHFNKELVMTKEHIEHFNSTKCWICGNDYVDNDVKVDCK